MKFLHKRTPWDLRIAIFAHRKRKASIILAMSTMRAAWAWSRI